MTQFQERKAFVPPRAFIIPNVQVMQCYFSARTKYPNIQIFDSTYKVGNWIKKSVIKGEYT